MRPAGDSTQLLRQQGRLAAGGAGKESRMAPGMSGRPWCVRVGGSGDSSEREAVCGEARASRGAHLSCCAGGVSAVTSLCPLLVPSEDTAVTSYTARSPLCSSE